MFLVWIIVLFSAQPCPDIEKKLPFQNKRDKKVTSLFWIACEVEEERAQSRVESQTVVEWIVQKQ